MKGNKRTLLIEKQSWELKNVFRISRGSRTKADIILVTITEGEFVGRAEVVPYSRYNESLDSVINQIESIKPNIEDGLEINKMNRLLPAGAARNALDCALWDLQAKKQHTSVHKLTTTLPFLGCQTAQTISIGSVNEMSKEVIKLINFPLIKVKLDNQQVIEKMFAISKASPKSQFIIDANEAWTIEELNQFSPILEKCRVALIEQPLPSNKDSDLTQYTGSIPLCADESIHTTKELDRVSELYAYINIKLDKTGGLSEALKLLHAAKDKGIGIMVGCMVGTSLAMAPASLIANYADFVDLDGPALLLKDREHGFEYTNGQISQLNPKLWGSFNKSSHAARGFRYFH